MTLKDKHAFITGGGTGIGLAYLSLAPGAEVAVEVRGKHLSGRVVRPPFQ